MIDITKVDLSQFVKDVFDLSVPQGLGFLHASSAPLSDEEVREILSRAHGHIALSMDYIHGRACKMTVYKTEDGKLEINDSWYDHTQEQLNQLLSRSNLPNSSETEHIPSCNCGNCRIKQGKPTTPRFSEVLR